MDKSQEKIKELARELRQTSLRKEDKRAMRVSLTSFMEEHPVQEKGSRYSYSFFRGHLRSNFFVATRGAVIGVVGALLIGGGVASAAVGSLPGDALYPVKVNLNEKVRSMTAWSPESEARLQMEFAQRRLREAEKLAMQGKLTPETEKNLESRFDHHAQKSEVSLSSISSANRAQIVSKLRTQFEVTLSAHAELLSQLVQEMTPEQKEQFEQIASSTLPGFEGIGTMDSTSSSSTSASSTETETTSGQEGSSSTKNMATSTENYTEKDATTTREDAQASTGTSTKEVEGEKEEHATGARASAAKMRMTPQFSALSKEKGESASVKSILSWVKGKQNEISQSRRDAEMEAWRSVSSKTKVFSSSVKSNARVQIKKAESRYENSEDVSEDVMSRVEKNIGNARKDLKVGDGYFDKEEYKNAFTHYRSAVRDALKAQILLKTSQDLKPYEKIKGFDGLELQVEESSSQEVEKGNKNEAASGSDAGMAEEHESSSTPEEDQGGGRRF